MALYSTFFLCKSDQLVKGFPRWRPPLPKPVRRKFTDPFTGEATTIETRMPEWPEDDDAQDAPLEVGVVVIEGRYKDYLEGRLPAFVQGQPHWCTKGILNIQLDALGATLELQSAVEDALYSPPSSGGAFIWRVRPELLAALLPLGEKDLKATAKGWAEVMSTPEHTQSVSGRKISEGWKPATRSRF